MKKNIFYFAIVITLSVPAFCFEWPIKDNTTPLSQFGQFRGGDINSSILFEESPEIYTSEAGKILVVISEHEDDFGWFESSLGSSVIIAHEDGITTVYSNLDEKTIPETVKENGSASVGELLGSTGNSGWQEKSGEFEFKVFDSKNDSAVNPKVILPRIEKEDILDNGVIILSGKDGEKRNLLVDRRLPSGAYSVYRTQQEQTLPFKTVVAINGTTIETISYDVIKESGGRLCVSGNALYSAKEIYPDTSRQLVGNILLNKGANTLTVTSVSITGTEAAISYKLEVY